MLDVQAASLSTLDVLVDAVAEGIVQKLEQHLGGLLWPAALNSLESFRLSMTTDTAVETTERNDFLLGNNVLQIGLSPLKGHALRKVQRET